MLNEGDHVPAIMSDDTTPPQPKTLEPVMEEGAVFAADGTIHDVDDDDDDDSEDDQSRSSLNCSTKAIESTKQRAAKLERQQLAKQETSAVFWIRIIYFVILVSTAVLVSLGAYLYTARDEEEDFQHAYDSSAERVIQSFHGSVANLLAGVDAFSVAVTSYALNAGENFPNVTVPDIELRGAITQVMTKGVGITWFPLVNEDDRLGWEAYATEMQGQQMKSFDAENRYIWFQDEMLGLEATNVWVPSSDNGGEERALQQDSQLTASICSICPGDAPVTNPDNIIQVPGQPVISCGHLQDFGRQGLISVTNCELAIQVTPMLCGCETIEPSLEPPGTDPQAETAALGLTCHVCPDSLPVLNPDNIVEISGQSDISCGQLYESGLQGAIPSELCVVAQAAFPSLCGCGIEDLKAGTGNNPFEESALNGLPFSPVIRSPQYTIQPNNTGPYFPLWQSSPALPFPALMTMNAREHPSLSANIETVLETNQAYLAKVVLEPIGLFDMVLARGQFRHDQEQFLGGATTILTYPIFDSFNTTDRKLAGITVSQIYWRLHFENVLPQNTRGIIAVLENSVNQSFTYQLDGSDVTFLGHGDYHDHQFNDMRWSADVSDYMDEYAAPETQGYLAVPLTKEAVNYKLHIYPSRDMKEDFVTNKPAIYATVIALVFAVTSSFFILYNCLVERRQKVVMDRAVKSTAVVSSLFPENVKERLINDEVDASLKTDKSIYPTSWKAKDLPNTILDSKSFTKKGKAIADKFENTTVMFADIAGFTSWSSDRDPEHVFALLETFYGAFDKIALARDVFKVETIGDCYLAITGCPSPQDDHAIRMAKFARHCMYTVRDLTDVLAESLGDDTRALSFRVGLHSGSVTAGVLRGDRTRFQLFGDTVNTAARIESHGVKGRIHVSQATFDAICKEVGRGKSSGWMIPRRDKVRAKGKGELQTYFMSGKFMRAAGKTNSTTSSRSYSSQGINSKDCNDLTESDFTDTIMEFTDYEDEIPAVAAAFRQDVTERDDSNGEHSEF